MSRLDRLLALLVLPLVLAPIARAAAQARPVDAAHSPDVAPGLLPIPVDAVIDDISAAATPGQHYALYLPPGYPGDRRWPLLVILDPRGQASPGASLASEGARRNGWIVMSAAGSRSDVPQEATMLALQALLVDAEQRFAVDRRRLYLAGMSGTAKSLWDVLPVLRERVAGIIACAGAPDGSRLPTTPPPAVVGCTGTRDFNAAQVHRLDAQLEQRGTLRRLEVFDGLHGWMGPGQFGQAIDWLEAVAVAGGRAARNDAAFDRVRTNDLAAIASADDPLSQWRALDQAVRDLDHGPDAAAIRARRDVLAASDALATARKRERDLFDGDRQYQRRVDAWFARMQPAQGPSGRFQPPPLADSLRRLDIAALKKQSESPETDLANTAWRRLALAHAAAASYLPQLARARGDRALETAASAVAEAIGPMHAPR